MNVELTSPTGGFHITPVKSKAQIINRRDDDTDQTPDASWQWRLEPTAAGKHELMLIVSSQEIDERGVGAEQAQVTQVLPIEVQVNYSRLAWKFARWGALAAGAGVIGYYTKVIVSALSL